MSINISPTILGLSDQRVNEIVLNKHHKTVHTICQRDKRRKAIDPLTGQQERLIDMFKGKFEIFRLWGIPVIWKLN